MNRLLLILAALACSDSNDPNIEPLPDISLVPVVQGLVSPIFLTAPAGDGRLFIAEQRGTIRVFRNGQLLATPFLDIRPNLSSGGERGLLGLAFHPNFATNGFFYINYTDVNGNTRVERHHANPTADVADAGSGTLVLAFNQPYANHNGGHLLFGPDGMLWIGTGDGGSGGDPQNYAQSTNTLLGKMLRIDVNSGSPYGIPANNPFATSNTNRREIWGIGLRNPWRFAIDFQTNELYVADVGQGQYEEVHVVPTTQSLVNYGWKIMEGRHCYGATSCPQTGLDQPELEYSHADGCSITGGFVYRGSAIPALRGHYFYSDYCTGFLRSFRHSNGAAVDHVDWDIGNIGNVLSFGQDSNGELYVLAVGSTGGVAYRIQSVN